MNSKHLYTFFLFWYSCGVILVGFDLLPSWLEWANVVFLGLSGIIGSLLFIHSYGTKRGIALSLFIFIGAMFAEYLGAEHDLIFGSYNYTAKFGVTLFHVPIAIGFAWLMVMGTTTALVERRFRDKPLLVKSALGASFAVCLDLILDPVSVAAKQYWVWQEQSPYYSIPLSNFVGWFAVAFVFHLVVQRTATAPLHPLWLKRNVTVYWLIAAMFLFIAALEQLWLAVAVSVVGFTFVARLTGRRNRDDSSKEK